MKLNMLLAVALLPAAAAIPTTKEIAPGVFMPYVNLGGVHSHPSNYSAWLSIGGVGLDTALMYGDDVQMHVGDAIRASKIPREKMFVTTKVPCCPAPFSKWCSWYASEYADLDAGTRAEIDLRLLGVDQVDLMLLHWPCTTTEQTIATYRALEEFALAGKARAIGISNFNASMIDTLYAAPGGLRVRPSINQCGFSIGGHNNSSFGRDFATLAKCKEKGITYSAYGRWEVQVASTCSTTLVSRLSVPLTTIERAGGAALGDAAGGGGRDREHQGEPPPLRPRHL